VASPTVFNPTGSSICSSSPNAGTVTTAGSQLNVSYQLQDAGNNNVQSAKAGTGSGLTWTGLAAGTYHIVATGAAPTSCSSTTSTADVTVGANPTVFNPTGSSICASAPGTGTITTSGSQTGVSYQLLNATNTNVQSAKSGMGSGLTWTSLPGGTYHIVATSTTPPNCNSTTNTADVTVVNNPTVFNLSGSAICASAPGTGSVSLDGSQSGVSYQLLDNTNTSVQSAKSGTGSPLTWTSLAAGTYHVVATGAAPTNCTSTTGPATVTINQNPVSPSAHIVTPLCTDNTLTVQLDQVVSGITYSLTQPGNNNPFSPDGTGKFTGLAFGVGYTITATDNTTSCASTPLNCGGGNSPAATQISSIKTQQSQKPQVLAAPNPFNDKIRFSFQSPVAGKGSLELYTLMGQKVATVYQGYIQKGQVQTIMYSVPSSQRTNLIYVFRIGDQKVSSMLIGSK
jgi:hypothetical protein